MSEFKDALESAKIKITKYDPSKQKSVFSSVGTMTLEKFSKVVLEKLGAKMVKYPEVIKAAHDLDLLADMMEEMSPQPAETGGIVIPPDMSGYTLNHDVTATTHVREFFLTTKDEIKSDTSGRAYIKSCKIPPGQEYDLSVSRRVIPRYRPRSPAGVETLVNKRTKEEEKIYNEYVPAEWVRWKKDNPKQWNKLPANPPTILMKALKHLIPIPEERQYLYAWIYASITARAYVYLVLCGAPGTGKNRLILILNGLHGGGNYTPGKKSTITERFNSQMSGNTLISFDEIKYDPEMINVMKEIQNDYLSIERKGVDTTKSTAIHSSMIITNNKPKDNHITFEDRKFAPLVVGSGYLGQSMSEQEIDLLSEKVDPESPGFDPRFVAQIAKWIERIGPECLKKHPNLEYRGPMFWTLAHTSMTRWQNKAISALTDEKVGMRPGWVSEQGAYLWSKIEQKISKRTTDHTMIFPGYSSVRAFFDIFRDGEGRKAFKTKRVSGINIVGDFWIYPLIDHVVIMSEATVAQQRERGKKDGAQKSYDI